jgi:hypothetical protein
MEIAMRKATMNYRTRFGLQDPEPNKHVRIAFMQGLDWYLVWENCPDNENILATGFSSKESAEAYALCKDWCLIISNQLLLNL